MDIDILFALYLGLAIFLAFVMVIGYFFFVDNDGKHYCKNCRYYMPGPRYDSPGRCIYYYGARAYEGSHLCSAFRDKE